MGPVDALEGMCKWVCTSHFGKTQLRMFRLSSGLSERKVEGTLELEGTGVWKTGRWVKGELQGCLGSCVSLCLDKEEGKNKNHTFSSKVFFQGRKNLKWSWNFLQFPCPLKNHQEDESYNLREPELCQYPACLRVEVRERDLALGEEEGNSTCRIKATFEGMQNLGLVHLHCTAIENRAC